VKSITIFEVHDDDADNNDNDNDDDDDDDDDNDGTLVGDTVEVQLVFAIGEPDWEPDDGLMKAGSQLRHVRRGEISNRGENFVRVHEFKMN
jgi:hypothetical protein